MKIKISDSAQLELDDIIEYYDQKENGPGKEFLDEIDKSPQIIIKWPVTWKLMGRRTRRFLCWMSFSPLRDIYQNLDCYWEFLEVPIS